MTCLAYFTAHIRIRRILDDLHGKWLLDCGSSTEAFAVRDTHLKSLHQWRINLPSPLDWQDTDDPSPDANAARMREQYYSALYILHGPYLKHALENCEFADGTDFPYMTSQSWRKQKREDGEISPETAAPNHKNLIINSCKACVEAAKQSTRAFNNIIEYNTRLTVTNLFGTAHA